MMSHFENVLRFAAGQGYEHPTVFVDRASHARLEIFERRLDAHFSTQIGANFEGGYDGVRHQIFCNDDSPQSLAEALGAPREPGPSVASAAIRHTSAKTLTIFARFLKEKYRSLIPLFPELSLLRLRVEFSHRHFSFHDLSEKNKEGQEQSASAFIGCVGPDGRFRELALHEAGEGVLYKKLKEEKWFEHSLQSLGGFHQTRAKGPKEKTPVVFSERAFAKLCAGFLKGFHANDVLHGRSFLNRVALPLDLKFSILESPIEGDWDQEGTERRAITLLDRGNPRALVSNRHYSRLFEIPSTGHGRRDHYRSQPRTEFWSPEIIGHLAVDNLLKDRKKAVLVEDLEILETEPDSLDVRLDVLESRWVRDGAPAEALAPFEWRTNLLDLLTKLECFSRKTRPLARRENGSPWLTQIRTPAALTSELELGSSPPQRTPSS